MRRNFKIVLGNLVNDFLQKMGYKVVTLSHGSTPDIDLDADFQEIYSKCKPYTMTSVQRMYSLYQSVNYVLDNNIPGDFVECGVWRGGSSMLIALTLLNRGVKNRKIMLYDTYEGMPEPSDKDAKIISGESADKAWRDQQKDDYNEWCYASVEEVRENLFSTSYPKDMLTFVKGKVEDTIPATVSEKISLLRLDTDWYSSTYHGLQHLYPLLEKNGVVIFDDYGGWSGARDATDQYFREVDRKVLLNRIDHTGRSAIKA